MSNTKQLILSEEDAKRLYPDASVNSHSKQSLLKKMKGINLLK